MGECGQCLLAGEQATPHGGGTLEHWSGYSEQNQQNRSGGQEVSGLETDLATSTSVQADAESATRRAVSIKKADQRYN